MFCFGYPNVCSFILCTLISKTELRCCYYRKTKTVVIKYLNMACVNFWIALYTQISLFLSAENIKKKRGKYFPSKKNTLSKPFVTA